MCGCCGYPGGGVSPVPRHASPDRRRFRRAERVGLSRRRRVRLPAQICHRGARRGHADNQQVGHSPGRPRFSTGTTVAARLSPGRSRADGCQGWHGRAWWSRVRSWGRPTATPSPVRSAGGNAVRTVPPHAGRRSPSAGTCRSGVAVRFAQGCVRSVPASAGR